MIMELNESTQGLRSKVPRTESDKMMRLHDGISLLMPADRNSHIFGPAPWSITIRTSVTACFICDRQIPTRHCPHGQRWYKTCLLIDDNGARQFFFMNLSRNEREPSMSNLSDKRSSARSNVMLWAELWIDNFAMPVCLRNISTSGTFLRTSPSVTGHGLVTLRIAFPHEEPFFVQGQVVRSQSGIRDLRQAGVSVSFVDLFGAKLEAVERYINRQMNMNMSKGLRYRSESKAEPMIRMVHSAA
jgi:hypothetical protein